MSLSSGLSHLSEATAKLLCVPIDICAKSLRPDGMSGFIDDPRSVTELPSGEPGPRCDDVAGQMFGALLRDR